MSLLIGSLAAINDILTAGIAITAFSLLLYALTFNLRDRVARAFAALLASVTIVFFFDAVASAAHPANVGQWLRWQWLGIAFVPVGYLHFSDALLATTGQPSRGRRRLAIRVLYGVSLAFLAAALLTDALVHSAVIEARVAYLQAGPLFPLYMAYFAGSLGWSAWNLQRAYRRTQTPTTRRRMVYLMASSAAPALGTFPFLLLAGRAVALHPLIFWLTATLANLLVTGLLVLMAYAVAYFGVTLPDRIIKSRLFQWLLRGPVVASTVLSVYVLLTRYGPLLPGYDPRLVPPLLVAVLLFMQFMITLVRLPVERLLFYGDDRAELRRLHILEERVLTSGDLHQFLESVLASLCDALSVPSAFLAALNDDGRLEYEVSTGPEAPPRTAAELPPPTAVHRPEALAAIANGNGVHQPAEGPGLFEWAGYWLLPLRGEASAEPLGLLGVQARATPLSAEQNVALATLADRAASALEDRRLQRDVFRAVDRLLPQIERLQRLRATAQGSGAQSLEPAPDEVITSPELTAMIKSALSHYWGGPKLTASPLMRLRVVDQALREHEGNAANALRAVLVQAIERLRPEGQRKFTADWILYNILELKFLQNRRVREVAMRLAVSEADLYRKQRTAIEQVARVIMDMEKDAAERAGDGRRQ